MSGHISKEKIVSWVKEAVGIENISVEIEGISDKTEGFLADMLFINVGLPGRNEYLYMVLKIGQLDLQRRKNHPFLVNAYKRECFFYEHVVPQFKEFQIEKDVTEELTVIPKCFKVFLEDNEEVIILENLKKLGYRIHNRLAPMNVEHISMVLKNLAYLHAISFAMQDQKKHIFKSLTANYASVLGSDLATYKNSFTTRINKLIDLLAKNGRRDLAKKIETLREKDVTVMLQEILNDIPKEKVILHGDAHNNNYMFKYKGEDIDNPVDVRMVDFQLSFLHSPVIDLSYHWYFVTSKNEYPYLNELLQFYHQQLSSFVNELGSNIDKLFSLSTLFSHWQKYSMYGFLQALLFMDLMFVETEDISQIENIKEGSKVQKLMHIELKNEKEYLQRIIAVIEHSSELGISL